MKAIAVALILIVCLCGCGNFTPLECEYCDGDINYHKIKDRLFTDQYSRRWEKVDGIYYHTWCLKIKTLEEKIEVLEQQIEEL